MTVTMPDCVVAAAGASSRMGGFKPLLPLGGRAMVDIVASRAREAGCRVLVVVGYRGDEVARLFEGREGVVVVGNPRWEEGMLGSIQAALGLVRGEAFFCMNADMPLVTAAAYAALAAARDARNKSAPPGAGPTGAAFFAAAGGREGHPVLLPAAWIPEILLLPRAGRMRDFLAGRPRELVELGDDAVLTDIDTPEDYRRLSGR